MNILILDNDECLGSFGFISNMYENLIGQYILENKLDADNKDRIAIEKLFINFAIELLNIGFGRPGLKEFLHMIKDLKEYKLLHYVIMYTSAARNNHKDETPYLNWVGTLRKILEKSVGHYKPKIQLYDLDHSGRSDENPPRMSKDGATQKSVDVVLDRLHLKAKDVKNVIFIDDRPQNIWKWEETKLVRLGVQAYFFLPELSKVRVICRKYDEHFTKLGLTAPSKIMADCYQEEVDDMKSENKPIGGVPMDSDNLTEQHVEQLFKTLFDQNP
jgi:hypothetical protein